MKKLFKITAPLILLAMAANADEPQVVNVNVVDGINGWQFNVSLLHGDTGWEHYADGWGVYTMDGEELGYRTLAHPHINEQPFTRSLSGVRIPDDITQVIIRPHDLVHGDGPDYVVTLK